MADPRLLREQVRVVAIGGGTGLPAVLRGMKAVLFRGGAADNPDRLTGVVAVTDDGGSSGRLRDELGMLPPGDLRNCLVALSHNEPLMARLFQARYRNGENLSGHSVGNLILAALAQEENGNFLSAVRMASDVLNIQGRVLPSTLVPARLVARLADGRQVLGETAIAAAHGRVSRLWVDPAHIPATPGVVTAIERADVVVLGPGSLYSSILANLLLPEITEALAKTGAFRVLITNAMTEAGETTGFSAAEHLRALREHAPGLVIDGVLVAEDTIPEATLTRYREEGAEPIPANDPDLEGLAPIVLRRSLLQVAPKVRHDPLLTASAVLEMYIHWQAERGLGHSETLPGGAVPVRGAAFPRGGN